MAAFGLQIIFGFCVLMLIKPSISTSRYCDIAYECSKTCYHRVCIPSRYWLWSRHLHCRTRAYTCKAICHNRGCCNGYTGTNCSTPTPCDEAKKLPDLERRARNYEAKGEIGDDPYVDDQYLGPDWYNVGNYRMPDSNTKPKSEGCGTKHQIYIKGTHPDISNMTDNSTVTLNVCEINEDSGGDCVNESSIEVRRCGGDIQYYLVPTSWQSAYCVDPPYIFNVTEFEEAPTGVTIGSLTVKPRLKFTVDNGYEIPYLQFDCLESPPANRSSNPKFLYSTYWFIDSVLYKAFERQNGMMTIDENDLIKDGYKLGITIVCGIRVSTSITGYQTEMNSSEIFFAGVKVEPLVISMPKDGIANITFTPTVPLGCYAEIGSEPTGKCTHSINMYYPERYSSQCQIDVTDIGSLPMVNSLQERCGVEIEGFYPFQAGDGSALEMNNETMLITSPYFSDSDPTEYRLGLKTKLGGTHGIWKNVFMPEVQLNILPDNSFKSKMCYAHVDPHMMTCDGKAYENNDYAGSFILYRHDTGIEVQMKTTLCNRNRAYCACAVAVRAGGDVFLINLCGGLRFIDMTSCKDGGALLIQKYSELKYQVQTNIGTLVKINILSGKYNNLMNIDIYMSPKDFNRVRGLCGTCDLNRNNDFHTRSGAVVNRKAFLTAWQVNIESDINLLDPSCTVDIGTWAEDGQLLYCTCNCYGELKDECGKPEGTATCSPTQYVNCSVSLSKSSDLCKDYEERCNIQAVRKRSAFYIDPEGEMKRRAALAELPHLFVAKRQTENSVTEEMAREDCTKNINTTAIKKNLHLIGGFDINQAITDCTYDVYTGQDQGWIQTHKQAAEIAIESGYKRDANYTISHIEELTEFRITTCPNECSGNGVCTENGTCTCNSSHFGPDCEHAKSERQVIEDIEGGGLCDQRYGSECKCFSLQAEALAEHFLCRMVRQKKMLGGETKVIGTDTTEGRYRNLYNGDCCFPEGRLKRSSETDDTDVLHYQYEISISNDDENFGPSTTVYVFDSLCLNANTENNGNVNVTLKAETCLIEGSCYIQNGVDISNVCLQCDPNHTQYNWTDGCITPSKDAELRLAGGIIAAIVVGITFFITFVIILVIWIKKGSKKGSSVNASQEFSSAPMVSTDNFKMSFNVQNLKCEGIY